MTTKIVLGVALIGAILGTLAFFNITPFRTIVQNVIAGSTSGSTYATQQTLAITGWNLANGTTTSIQNTSGSDEYATQVQYACTGVGSSNTAYTGAGLASVTLKAATTSTSLTGQTPTSNTGVSNTNLAVSGTLATSTGTTMVASSTLSIGGSVPGVWIANGAWLTFFSNATNTAVCNIGVQVIGT